MKRLKQILCFTLVLALTFIMLPAKQAKAEIVAPSTKVIFVGDSTSIDVSGLTAKNKLSSPKSSNSSVVQIISYSNSSNAHKSVKVADEGYNGNTSYYYGSVTIKAKKAGTATVSYKIGSKTYKTKVTVKKFTNPVKSITLTNVNGGKNFASRFKSNVSYTSLTLKNGTLKLSLTTNSGWKLTGVYYNNQTKGYYGNYFSLNKTKITNLSLGSWKKKSGSIAGSITLSFANGGATKSITLQIR